jgi:hypothetical protein
MKGRRILPREQRKSAPLRGVDRLMQPVPAHNKIYCLQYSWLDLSSQARRGKHGVARSFGTKIFILRETPCSSWFFFFFLRPRRLELPCLSAPAPQAGVSTSSTKAAITLKSSHFGHLCQPRYGWTADSSIDIYPPEAYTIISGNNQKGSDNY